MEPEDVTELLQFFDKTWADEELLLNWWAKKVFFAIESIPDEDGVKIVEMATNDLLIECYISFVGKAVSGFEGIDSRFYCG